MKQIFTRMFFGIAFPLLLCLVTGGVMAQPIQPILDSSDKFYSIGDFKKAMQIARIAGTIALRDSGFKSKIYAQILGLYYSMNLEGQGKLDSTEYYYLSGINIYRELGASNDTVYSTILINLANFYNARMQLPSKAASYFKEAEAIIKEKMSDGNIDKAAFYNNIGLYYYHTNQFKEADDQFNESLRLMELYHPSSIDTSIFTIVNLVELYKILGLYNRAYEKEYEYLRKVNYGDVGNKRAVLSALMQLNELAIYTHPEHPLTDSLNKIMEDLKLKKVDTIYVNACIIANKLRRYLFTDPKEVVRIYNEMGNLRQNPYYAGGTFAVIDIIPIMLDAYGQTGEINKAITLFEESVYQNKDWNNHNILRRWLYMQQGVCLYLMAGNKTKAKALLQELVTMSTNRIYPTFSAQPDYLKWGLVSQLRFFISTIAFYIEKTGDNDQQLVDLLFDYQLRFRGTIMNEQIILNKYIKKSDNKIALDSLHVLNDLQNKLAQLYLKSGNADKIKQIERQEAKLKEYLASVVPNYSKIDAVPLNRKELFSKLKKGSVLVDFIRYGNLDSAYSLKSRLSYAALIFIAGDTFPKFVPLFKEEEIKSIINACYKKDSILNAKRKSKSKQPGVESLTNDLLKYNGKDIRPLTEFYKMTWGKIEKYLPKNNKIKTRNYDSTLLYYLPNGILSILPMEAFGPSKMQYMHSNYKMVQLQSYLTFAFDEKIPSRTSIKMELWGDINYGIGNLSKEQKFTNLGNAEVDNILRVLTGSNFVIKQYKKKQATKNLFREAKHNYDVAHLSTHGFYDPEVWKSFKKPIFSISKMGEVPYFTFMSYSGLAFAGANEVSSSNTAKKYDVKSVEKDGVLYSYEIKDIDFTATELIVLSACETGLGKIVVDEGPIGLQQAFRLAGATKIIMSLWELNKEYTGDWMKVFYSYYRSTNHNGDAEYAFNKTQKQFIDEGKPPYFWAGFVLVR